MSTSQADPSQSTGNAPQQGESGRDQETTKEVTQNAAPPADTETTYMAAADPEETDVIATEGNEETLISIEKRHTKLTSKANELYLTSKNQLERKLEKTWVSTKNEIVKLNACNDDINTIRSYMNFVRAVFNKYRDVHEQLSTLMTRANTQQSLQECRTLTEISNNRDVFVTKALQEARVRCQDLIETTSVLSRQSSTRSRKSSGAKSNLNSGSSQSSTESQRRSDIQRDLAKLEEEKRVGSAATLRKIAELEIETSRQKERARLQEEEEKEAAKIARRQAELTMQLSMIDELESAASVEGVNDEVLSAVPVSSKHAMVEEFVHSVCHSDDNPENPPVHKLTPVVEAQETGETNAVTNSRRNPPDHIFNDKSASKCPANITNQATNAWLQHFARRDLVTTGLTRFDDIPENFRPWKSSFRSVVDQVNLSPKEELDLLVKWCGNKSSELVKRIRAVHIERPDLGLIAAWARLTEDFGQPEVIAISLISKVKNQKKIHNADHKMLRDFGDALLMLEYAKADGGLPGLEYLDTFMGINPLMNKLPEALQEKWRSRAHRYKLANNGRFPTFASFSKFVREMAAEKCDPSFSVRLTELSENQSSYKPSGSRYNRHSISVNKTEVNQPSKRYDRDSQDGSCPLHGTSSHDALNCRALQAKNVHERRDIIKKSGLCLKCIKTTSHKARDCNAQIKCAECGSGRHPTILHMENQRPQTGNCAGPSQMHGGEPREGHLSTREESVTSTCTEVCGPKIKARSCAKICQVKIYHKDRPDMVVRSYVVMDDQSNRSLAKSQLFDKLNISTEPLPYTLNTCSGRSNVVGRRAKDLVIEALNGSTKIPLPVLLECNEIPDNRTEIPSPQVAVHHEHLRPLADRIPDVDPEVDIMLLLGRDVPQVHKIRESRNGPNNAPWAQRLDLGWVILGEVCKGKVHQRSQVNAFRTQILENGRPSLHTPCDSHITVSEDYTSPRNFVQTYAGKFVQGQYIDNIGEDIYVCTEDDHNIGPSIDDRQFTDLMNKEMKRNEDGYLTAPLPLREDRTKLPDNKAKARHRFSSLVRSLQRKPEMQQHYIDFMKKMIIKGHAELAPPSNPDKERWYLPHFGVYHPKKPGKIRVVFDSSDKVEGQSLNGALLAGPDLLNSLLGVLIRFRRDSVACIADIEQMFYSFFVEEKHRDFLRFFWFKDSDPQKEVVEYRMKVHIFGNSPSPAVATFGLRKTAQEGERQYGEDARWYVERDFYCDDGLFSISTPGKAIDLLRRTKAMLAVSNLRLHKIASNNKTVMDAFPTTERASGICDLDLDSDEVPLQRSLGILWDLQKDVFTFKVSTEKKPFTKRGVLSVINSLFDPLGFVQPVVIGGKILLREMTMDATISWDDDLPKHLAPAWNTWYQSLLALETVQIPRCYTNNAANKAVRRELHVFADASEKAIGAVAYLKVLDEDNTIQVSFIMGKAKLSPKHATTIPRLELNSAVLAVELSEAVSKEICLKIDEKRFYSDSKVVLGYLTNRKKRFYVYVSNRVQRVLRSTSSNQWSYIPSHINPADLATRPVSAEHLSETSWFKGPDILRMSDFINQIVPADTSFTVEDDDKEVRPELTVLATVVSNDAVLSSKRFARFSRWQSLLKAIARLTRIARCIKDPGCRSSKIWHMCPLDCEDMEKAKKILIQSTQKDAFNVEIQSMQEDQELPKSSPLLRLNPYLDENGTVRVGGRLKFSEIEFEERHPIILAKDSHISTLLCRHYHTKIHHQGQHLTTGALRSNGYWILGCKRLVASLIAKCVSCRKQRGKRAEQKMSDLPIERVTPDAPFTYVGVDVFGHWFVAHRLTRGNRSQSKRWAVLFTCFSTRAVHIELIESMDTSTFINALRRFLAIRGPAKKFYSDCGTNIVAGCKELDMDKVKDHLLHEGCEWSFNPPHASHMGGVWERMIGIARKILDSMFAKLGSTHLTHDILNTFLAEVTAIINARPLVPVSSDPETPEVLTPSTLLTQKTKVLSAPPGSFRKEDMFGRQWRRVQYLADVFWSHWRREYLPTLQPRVKWQKVQSEIKQNDLVLIRDKAVHRNEWPIGRVISTSPSKDGRTRRVEVKVCKGGCDRTYERPINELVLLLRSEKIK